MSKNIFIPKKIRVGYQERSDTYTKKLAYVTYLDAKGILRKEKSWDGWRDKKIQPQNFDNTPQSGFCINKNVERYNWSHFGSNRSYIRMYDPRGIEFEISVENLIGILMHNDCIKRELDGEFVYAWQGKELMLLPVTSLEYKDAQTFTKMQGKNISFKDLKPGFSYQTKTNKEAIYMGYYTWYDWDSYSDLGRKSKKKHIFYVKETSSYLSDHFKPIGSGSALGRVNSDQSVIEFPDLVEKLKNDFRVNSILGYEDRDCVLDIDAAINNSKLRDLLFQKQDADSINFYRIKSYSKTRGGETQAFAIDKYKSLNKASFVTTRHDNYGNHNYFYHDKNVWYEQTNYGHSIGYNDGRILDRKTLDEKLAEINPKQVHLKLENGNLIPITQILK